MTTLFYYSYYDKISRKFNMLIIKFVIKIFAGLLFCTGVAEN